MLIIKISLLLSSIIFLGNIAFAQPNSNSKLGLNSNLYNGKYYSYFLPSSINGHQFLESKEYSVATVWKNGESFEDLLLNYDVVNQEVILKFKTSLGAEKVIAMSMAELDSFLLSDKLFISKSDIEDDQLIYQKIQYGGYNFYIYFHKELKLQSQINNVSYQISKVNRTIYFANKSSINRINKNRSFLKFVDKESQNAIKKYMKSKKYKIHKMNDAQYLDLLKFMQKEIDEKH